MIHLDREYVEQLTTNVNVDAFAVSFDLIKERLNIAMNNLMTKNAFITDYGIEIANEVLTGAETTYSTLDIYLELNAQLIEKNDIDTKKNSFKNWWARFFDEFKNNLKIFSRKKKSQKQMEKAEKKLDQTKLYTIKHLFRDIQIQLSKVHYNTARIQFFADKIQILDKNDYACEINVYPIITNNSGIAKRYVIGKKEPQILDFKNRFKNIESLHDITNEMSLIQLRLLNSIFYKIFKRSPNQVFVESLIFNVPFELYTDDVYETAINIFNYFNNSTMQNYTSICDNNKKLFADDMNTETIDVAIKLIKNVSFE